MMHKTKHPNPCSGNPEPGFVLETCGTRIRAKFYFPTFSRKGNFVFVNAIFAVN